MQKKYTHRPAQQTIRTLSTSIQNHELFFTTPVSLKMGQGTWNV